MRDDTIDGALADLGEGGKKKEKGKAGRSGRPAFVAPESRISFWSESWGALLITVGLLLLAGGYVAGGVAGWWPLPTG